MKEQQERSIHQEEIEAALEYQTPVRLAQHRKGAEDRTSTGVHSEDLFYGVNRAVKGKSVTSQSQKKLL